MSAESPAVIVEGVDVDGENQGESEDISIENNIRIAKDLLELLDCDEKSRREEHRGIFDGVELKIFLAACLLLLKDVLLGQSAKDNAASIRSLYFYWLHTCIRMMSPLSATAASVCSQLGTLRPKTKVNPAQIRAEFHTPTKHVCLPLVKQLSAFVRARQPKKLPVTRSGMLFTKTLENCKVLLPLQDLAAFRLRVQELSRRSNSPLAKVVSSCSGKFACSLDPVKWIDIEPEQNLFNPTTADEIVRFDGNTSLSATKLDRALGNHITTDMDHYRGKLYSWDVITCNQSSSTGFYFYPNRPMDQLIGDALFSVVSSFLEDGVPVDAIGFQCHFTLGQAPDTLAITELDINLL
ncbi:hypothetical protein DFH11DRAFT_1733866 [Phellopilus nigrolimitatus]|nr:hypothetical protein DFH11DRAFT_1733866 [Phellopilus nigrolimitatus]